MKCAKCGYLGFEPVERCRNCGYDFSLAPPVDLPELRLRRDETDINPSDDLALIDRQPQLDSPRFAADVSRDLDLDLDRDLELGTAARQAPAPPPTPPARPPLVFGAEPELPLFGPPITDDVPLITKASPPRPPLAVRRATPDPPRLRPAEAPRAPSLDLTLDLDSPPAGGSPPRWAASRARALGWTTPRESGPTGTAGFGRRIAAAAIDLLILATIDAIVVYFTLRICGVVFADLNILPKGPLLAFLLVQNGGYLVAFTVTGQTLGKMAAGIKVIPAESDAPLDIDRALLRTFLWLVLAVPAGLGFVSALFNRDRCGLHDRFARTRVVRASPDGSTTLA
jgi:uncharacterized RDD family membrane protein YckC